MEPTARTARLAGALYLFIVVTGIYTLMIVPSRLLVRGDAVATARNILASEMLFRSGILVGLASTVGFTLLVFTLYRLLHRVDRAQAALMVIFALLAPATNLTYELATINVLHGNGSLAAFAPAQQQALASLLLGLRGPDFVVAEMYWGLWLFPFAILVIRSGFLPRALGWFLVVNGLAYVALSVTGVMAPAWVPLVEKIAFVPQMGEVAIMLWLLIMGGDPRRATPAAGGSGVPAAAVA
jgi:hypothetical protein